MRLSNKRVVALGVFSEPGLEGPADCAPVLVCFDAPKRFTFKATDRADKPRRSRIHASAGRGLRRGPVDRVTNAWLRLEGGFWLGVVFPACLRFVFSRICDTKSIAERLQGVAQVVSHRLASAAALKLLLRD